MLLVFCLVVFLKETEILIQAFGPVKEVEVLFGDDKSIEIMVSQIGYGGLVFSESFQVCHCGRLILQFRHECDGELIVELEVGGPQLLVIKKGFVEAFHRC